MFRSTVSEVLGLFVACLKWLSYCTGTWAGGVLTSRKTIVSEFVKLIADHENAVEIPLNGVGSDIGIVDRILGGKSFLDPGRARDRELINGSRRWWLGYTAKCHHCTEWVAVLP